MTSRPTRNVRRKTAWRGLTGPLPGLAAVADAVADSWWVASDDEETPFPSKCIRRTGVSCARATSDRTERSSRQDDDDDDDDCRRVILLSSETRDDYAFWTSAFPSLSLSLSLSLSSLSLASMCQRCATDVIFAFAQTRRRQLTFHRSAAARDAITVERTNDVQQLLTTKIRWHNGCLVCACALSAISRRQKTLKSS